MNIADGEKAVTLSGYICNWSPVAVPGAGSEPEGCGRRPSGDGSVVGRSGSGLSTIPDATMVGLYAGCRKPSAGPSLNRWLAF